jgi:hypothetical protein
MACTSKKEADKPADANPMAEMSTEPLSDGEMRQFLAEMEEELKQLDPQELNDVMVGAISEIQAELPLDVSMGMIISDIQIADSAIVYNVICDESLIDMNDFDNATQEEKDSLNNAIQLDTDNPQNALFLTICKVAKLDMKYVFVGSDTEKQFEVVMKHEDM